MAKPSRRSFRPEHRKLYSHPAWPKLRKRILLRDNYTCQWHGCGRSLIGRGDEPNAPVAHHIKDHKGDRSLFFDEENLMAICKACRDGPIQRETHRGYVSGHDEDCRPLDPDHPWNRRQA